MSQTTSRSPIIGKDSFETDYHPLKWKTALSWEKDGILAVIRIGRKCFLRREDIDRIIAEGGRQFDAGWRRGPQEA